MTSPTDAWALEGRVAGGRRRADRPAATSRARVDRERRRVARTAAAQVVLVAVAVCGILLAIELAFFVPWWVDGLCIHAHELGARLAIVSLWLPMVAIGAILAWTLRARGRLRSELAHHERVRAWRRSAPLRRAATRA